MKIYYAHPMSWYDKDDENKDLMTLQQKYPDAEIINPNNALFESKVQLALIEGHDVMSIFTNYIKDQADMVVFRAFDDDMIGAGVAQEVFAAHIWGKPIAELRTKRCDDSRYIWQYGRGTWLERVLTVSETKARVKAGTL